MAPVIDWNRADKMVFWKCPTCGYESIPFREVVSNLPICLRCTHMATFEEYFESEFGESERDVLK